MTGFVCDWCRAKIVKDEKMVSINLTRIIRKPKRWGAIATFFDSGADEVTLHASCFASHADVIAKHLFPNGADDPKQRPLHPDFPMWTP